MGFLDLPGLQYFYNKYIKGLKSHAFRDPANNLTTTASGYALDARQGKALNDKVTQLNSALDNDLYFLHIQTSSQSNFSSAKNMLLIDNTNKYGANNKSGYFFMDEDDHSEWTGLPPSMPSGTVLGLRNVYPMNIGVGTENILVEIIEMFPMPGRKYYCFLNYGIWDNWRTVTPS